MDERYRLIRAIEAEPDDDLPRLVFADWLEEHGEPQRARFIRLQCEFERLFPPHAAPPTGSPRYQELGAEIKALLKEHEGAWRKGLPKWALALQFRRGFPDVWQMTGKQFLDDAATIRAVVPLPMVCLRLLKGKEAAVLSSPHLEGVSRLWLQSAQLTDAGVEVLVSSPHLGQVRELRLDRDDFADAGDANKLSDASAVALAGADNLPLLVDLSLRYHRKVTIAGIRAITESERRAGLTALGVSGASGGPEVGELFRPPGFRLAALRQLLLDSLILGDAGVEALAVSPGLGGLEWLWLSCNKIGDRGVAALASSPSLARLTWIELWKNSVTDAGARAIADSPHLRNLRSLTLSDNSRVSDEGVRALLADGREWESLKVEGTAVSESMKQEVAERCKKR